jgi:hypothetical protein
MRNLIRIFIPALILLAACEQPIKAFRASPVASSKPGLPPVPTKQNSPTYIQKIDSNLIDLLADYRSGKDLSQAAQERGLTVGNNKEVLVDIYVNGSVDQASSDLTKLGMTVQSTSEAYKVVEGFLPIDSVDQAAQKEVVKAILPVMATGTNQTQP